MCSLAKITGPVHHEKNMFQERNSLYQKHVRMMEFDIDRKSNNAYKKQCQRNENFALI